MTRLQHCAFVAVTIVALGTTITSLSHSRGREAPLDVPEYELHTPPHPDDPIGFDANGTQCLFEANLDALGAYRDAYVEKLPLCPTTSAGRRMQDDVFFVVTSANILSYCRWSLRSCQACRCRSGHVARFSTPLGPTVLTTLGHTGGMCTDFRERVSSSQIPPLTCEGGQLEIRGENKFFCNAGCSLMHGCTAVE